MMIDLKKLLKNAFQSEDKQQKTPVEISHRCSLAGRCARCTDECPIHRQNNIIARDGGKDRNE